MLGGGVGADNSKVLIPAWSLVTGLHPGAYAESPHWNRRCSSCCYHVGNYRVLGALCQAPGAETNADVSCVLTGSALNVGRGR